VRLFRKENIEILIRAVQEDEFDDSSQDEARVEKGSDATSTQDLAVEFLNRHLIGPRILEVGCGSGGLFGVVPISHGIEPNLLRVLAAEKKSKELGLDILVEPGVIECIPKRKDSFDSVFMIRGFHQIRSDYEAFIEVNRVLRIGGRFIVDIFSNDDANCILGRSYGWKHFVRTAENFGFKLFAIIHDSPAPLFVLPSAYLCLEKIRDFNYRELNQLQIVKKGDCYQVNNFFPEGRDWRLI
jgi:SAM-dependent methyltransferase